METLTKKKKQTPAKKNTYEICLSVNGNVLSSDNQNVVDAIRSLIPDKIATKAIVKVSTGGKVSEKVLMGANQARKIVNNKTYAELFVKHLLVGLK